MAVEVTAPFGEVDVGSRSWEAVAEDSPSAACVESAAFAAEFSTGVIIGGMPYSGSYEVTPTTGEQVMPTRMKTMADDMTVHSIPCSTTTNESGGWTVSIAS